MDFFTLDGGAIPATDPIFLSPNYVDPTFFETVDVPVIRGRGFTDEDATASGPVVLINETTARQSWPDQNPVGKRFGSAAIPELEFRVVGVVRDAYGVCSWPRRSPLAHDPRPHAQDLVSFSSEFSSET